MSDPVEATSAEAEQRKLWLDYLGKLNDRTSRADQASGMTTWVLIGLLGTLLYTGIPKLPLLIAPVRHWCAIYLMLGADCLVCLNTLRGILIDSLLPEYFQLRSASLISRSVDSAVVIVLAFIFLVMSALQFQLTRVDRYLPSNTRACLLAFAWLLLIGATFGVIQRVVASYRELKYKIRVPLFNRVKGSPSVIVVAALAAIAGIVWSIFSGTTLGIALKQHGRDWLTPLGAAAYSFVFLLVMFELAARPVRRITTERAFAELEQQIVVEDLSSNEIKQRFVEQLLGPTLQQWLTDIGNRISAEYDQRESVLLQLERQLAEIHALGSPGEKLRAIEKVTSTITSEIRIWDENTDKLAHLLPDLNKLRVTGNQRAALQPISDDLRRHFERAKALNSRLRMVGNDLTIELLAVRTALAEMNEGSHYRPGADIG